MTCPLRCRRVCRAAYAGLVAGRFICRPHTEASQTGGALTTSIIVVYVYIHIYTYIYIHVYIYTCMFICI